MSKEKSLPDGLHRPFAGNEEDGVVVKVDEAERQILSKTKAPIEDVQVSSEQAGYSKSNIIDQNDYSWWIAGATTFTQTVTIRLKESALILAGRIRFQKDSSSYTHQVEVSDDGKVWTTLFERQCTGWDFKPFMINRKMRYLRLTIKQTSEGRAGLAEITLFQSTY